MINLYSGAKGDIEKAKKREYEKAIKYITDSNYLLYFKMIFEKEKIKLNISEENHINTEIVPCNEVTRRLKKEYRDMPNKYADWAKFDSNKNLLEMVERINCYPVWVKYDWIDRQLVYNEEYIRRKKDAIIENFRLNMRFYEKLDKNDFDNCLNKILSMKKNKGLKEVSDLKEFLGVKGIYIMVLDKYKQIYIGQSQRDVVARIIQYWSKKVEFENLLIGSVDKSKLRIDNFGILDTTRIYIEEVETLLLDKREEELVDLIPEEYLANLVAGGIKLEGLESGLKFMNTFKRRNLK